MRTGRGWARPGSRAHPKLTERPGSAKPGSWQSSIFDQSWPGLGASYLWSRLRRDTADGPWSWESAEPARYFSHGAPPHQPRQIVQSETGLELGAAHLRCGRGQRCRCAQRISHSQGRRIRYFRAGLPMSPSDRIPQWQLQWPPACRPHKINPHSARRARCGPDRCVRQR